ncbi:MAG: type II secretion system F family protein [Eubacterium sp.]|nr:type II secretion system F family protein [Eubacterium sp.]MBR1530928.1 type II secretion system F family protein [Eubacterium sp.]
MTGSLLSIIVLSITFALLVFALTFIITSAISADKIAAEKRLEELNKTEGDGDVNVALVKNESKTRRNRKERQRQHSRFDEKVGNAIYKQLQSADIKMRPEEFLIVWILLAFVPGALVVVFTGNVILTLILIVIGALLPVIYVRQKKKSRVKKFEEQLCDALMICCSCLRSGLSFNQAMETIAKDMDAPISTEFSTVVKEVNMGYSMDEALENLGDRIKSKYVDLMVSAVLVQRQTGGNLSHILENISDTIRERMKLKRQLKTSVSSGKMSGIIVGAMPVIILGLFTLISFDFVAVLYTEPRGNILLAIAAGLEGMAFMFVKKITTVKM